jgi:hypothetical protein
MAAADFKLTNDIDSLSRAQCRGPAAGRHRGTGSASGATDQPE